MSHPPQCDQIKPACTRCARLSIPCVGSGEQRYKFKEHSLVLRHSKKREGELAAVVFREPPSNQISRLAAEFVDLFKVDNLRYDISAYGPFFPQIPVRLGRSEAIDAATDAVCKTLHSYRSGVITQEALSSYVKALNALRATLMDPAKAHSIDALLAIHMTMICQGWLHNRGSPTTNHGEGMAAIMAVTCKQGLLPILGYEATYTITVTIIIESITNRKIKLQPWLATVIDQFADNRAFISPCDEVIRLERIARIPDLLRDPIQHMHEHYELFELTRRSFSECHARLVKWSPILGTQGGVYRKHINQQRMLLSLQTAYGIFLTMALVSGAFITADGAGDASVAADMARFHREAIKLAHVAQEHRPMGAAHLLVVLTAAWASSEDLAQRDEIWALLQDYQADFPHEKCLERCIWLRARIDSVYASKLLYLDQYTNFAEADLLHDPSSHPPMAMSNLEVPSTEKEQLCVVM
ncbi:hypothetical protein B0I35DRAFT_481769 [Stachybotrys elegans]|uniref:Zn(2)-C6 fungal-type domain-containing protein n=1 Tax=Stachybotrys elegans TaxID=80388 RepID=A0A8K0SID0_9HYPO|nr:hypothetical protein B0I35DRAFT_481769 [Stachybotrys elegans]